MTRVVVILLLSALTLPARVLPAQVPYTPDLDLTKKELVAAFSSAPLVLDPREAFGAQDLQIATAIYEGLVTYHPYTLQPVLGVAESWEVSDDGRIYRFHLRPDARYSNGDQVTAQDFRNTWMRSLDPSAEGVYSFFFDIIKGATEYRTGLSGSPEAVGIRAISDTILEVELSRPVGHFLYMLCHMAFVPLHPEYHSSSGWGTAGLIVGNGPFRMTRWTDQEMRLVKNRYYWDEKKVQLDKIEIYFTIGLDEIARGVNDGRIHWAENGNTEALRDVSAIQFHPLFATSFLFFLTEQAPWSDPRVRRALALLVPWESIRGSSPVFPAYSLVPTLSFYPSVEGIREADVDGGMSLLAEAGFPQGEGLADVLIRVPRGSMAEDVAHRMAEAWEESLPISVNVASSDYGTYLRELEGRDYTLGTMTWIGDFLDPLTFLQIWTSTSRLNEARYANPEFDALLSEAMSALDETRYEKLAETERILLADTVVLPLSHPPALNIIDLDRVGGWFPNPLDIHPFKYLRFKPRDMPQALARL